MADERADVEVACQPAGDELRHFVAPFDPKEGAAGRPGPGYRGRRTGGGSRRCRPPKSWRGAPTHKVLRLPAASPRRGRWPRRCNRRRSRRSTRRSGRPYRGRRSAARSRPGRAQARAAPSTGRPRRSALRRPSRQPATAPSPTRPAPKTTHVAPGCTFAVFSAAPSPVENPQANTHASASGASGEIFASAISGMTVYSANVEVPMKCRIGSPSRESRVVPSGRNPCSAARGSPGTGSSARPGSARTHGTAARTASRRDRRGGPTTPPRRPSRPHPRPRGRAPSVHTPTDRRPTPCRDPCDTRRRRRVEPAPHPPSARPDRPPAPRAARRTPRGPRR